MKQTAVFVHVGDFSIDLKDADRLFGSMPNVDKFVVEFRSGAIYGHILNAVSGTGRTIVPLVQISPNTTIDDIEAVFNAADHLESTEIAFIAIENDFGVGALMDKIFVERFSEKRNQDISFIVMGSALAFVSKTVCRDIFVALNKTFDFRAKASPVFTFENGNLANFRNPKVQAFLGVCEDCWYTIISHSYVEDIPDLDELFGRDGTFMFWSKESYFMNQKRLFNAQISSLQLEKPDQELIARSLYSSLPVYEKPSQRSNIRNHLSVGQDLFVKSVVKDRSFVWGEIEGGFVMLRAGTIKYFNLNKEV